MSNASALNDPLRDPSAPVPLTTVPTRVARWWSGAIVVALATCSVVALIASLVLWQRVSGMREQLARQSADAVSQAMEARTLARQAQDVVRDTAARLALNETRVAEVALQRGQLEELMQSLSRSRDETLVIDIDSTIRLALQQAQATGDLQPLLGAMKAAEQRIDRSAQPRLAPLQRAITQDIDRLRSTPGANRAEAIQRLDNLIRLVDDMPAANAVAMRPGSGNAWRDADQVDPQAPWWRRFLASVHNEARGLLRVGRVDRPEAVLLSPDQVFFLRENLKLKMLNARLSVLSRQTDAANVELSAIGSAINRYFDPSSRRVQSAVTLLQQLQSQLQSIETPRIDDTLAALATAAAGR